MRDGRRHQECEQNQSAMMERLGRHRRPGRFVHAIAAYGLQLTFCDVDAEPSTVMSG